MRHFNHQVENVNELGRLMKARIALINLTEMNKTPFTNSQYKQYVKANYERRECASLDFLKDNEFISVDHTETFYLTLKKPYTAEVLVNDNGEVVEGLTWYEYHWASNSTKRALDKAYNNGRPLRAEEREIRIVKVTRYYYTANFEKITNAVISFTSAGALLIQNYTKKMRNLTRKIEAVNAMLDLVSHIK